MICLAATASWRWIEYAFKSRNRTKVRLIERFDRRNDRWRYPGSHFESSRECVTVPRYSNLTM